MAAGNGHILKEAVSSFITDRAVMGVVHHEPLDHMLAEINSLLMSRRNDHSVLSVDHAAHLNAFDRAVQEHHRTHAACAHRPQASMVAETGNGDSQLRRSLDHLHPLWDFNFKIVNLQLRHSLPKNVKVQISKFKSISNVKVNNLGIPLFQLLRFRIRVLFDIWISFGIWVLTFDIYALKGHFF
jgi:hypothetical protein